MNRRNFIETALAAIAAVATRKWPALNFPEPVKRAKEIKAFPNWDAVLGDDIGSLLAIPRKLAGKVIYVDTNGNDDRDGSSKITAKRTLSAAIDAASVNDTIFVVPGSYYEPVAIVFKCRLLMDGSTITIGEDQYYIEFGPTAALYSRITNCHFRFGTEASSRLPSRAWELLPDIR